MKKKITLKRLAEELIKLNMIYSPKKTNAELKVLTDVFFEDCNHMSEERFLLSVKQSRQKAKFFPVPSDILEAYAIISERQRSKIIALPAPVEISEEQKQLNLKRLGEIKLNLKSL